MDTNAPSMLDASAPNKTAIDSIADDIEAASIGAPAKRLQKERDKLGKQLDELRHYADQRIALDVDDGVKVNYGRFGDLFAEVNAVTGKTLTTNH